MSRSRGSRAAHYSVSGEKYANDMNASANLNPVTEGRQTVFLPIG